MPKLVSTARNLEEEHTACEQMVEQRIQDYTEKIRYYQRQLHEKKTQLVDFTSNMEQAIVTFVHQSGITSIRLKCDFAIAVLYYDYTDHQLQYQYEQENPTEYQVRRFDYYAYILYPY